MPKFEVMFDGQKVVGRINEILAKRNENKDGFCKFVKVTPTAITHWKRDGAIPSVEVMMRVADYLGVSMCWLLTGEDEDGLASDERDLVASYRRLDDRDRQDVVGLIMLKLERYEQAQDQAGEKTLA
jgi:transcriptional regulator with XRE-family HTH domain